MEPATEQKYAIPRILSFDPDGVQPRQRTHVKSSYLNALERLGHEIFRHDRLDRGLKRHHITGIAFSGVVGIGMFQDSGKVIALGGPVGALLAFVFAGLIIFSVMRSLAEMISVRPVKGAVMDFPDVFVDEALGFAVGLLYWLANCMSMVTLTMASAMYTQYWGAKLGIAPATFILLIVLVMMNACGVRLYGNLEWAFKWLKIFLMILVCITMLAIKAGGWSIVLAASWLRWLTGTGAPRSAHSGPFELVPGYSPTAFFRFDNMVSTLPTEQSDVPIPGTGGRILAVWTCLTIAMFQFFGGEMVLVTAAEAESPRRDIPAAARYMYRFPVTLYLIAIILVGLCIDYLDPLLPHQHVQSPSLIAPRLMGFTTAETSPFVIAIVAAGISVLPSFLNAAFLFSALTAANSALYVSSRILFFLARNSAVKIIRNTIGRTNNGHTPLTAIFVSSVPGMLAFLVVKAPDNTYREPIARLSRLYTGPMLCIYASECIAFIRFQRGMKLFSNTIERDSEIYKKEHYRAHWQPLWAILGLVLCVLLMVFQGWTVVYDLCADSRGVSREDSIVDLVSAYLGPAVFVLVYVGYKFRYRTKLRSYASFRDKWFPDDVPDESDINASGWEGRGGIKGFLSWLR